MTELRAATYILSAPPPSQNECRIPARGRLIDSPEYRKWKKAAAEDLAYAGQNMRQVPLRAGYWSMSVWVPKGGADLDNVSVKAIADALVKAKKVPDDRYLVWQLSSFIGPSMMLHVHVTEENIDHWADLMEAPLRTRKRLLKERLDGL